MTGRHAAPGAQPMSAVEVLGHRMAYVDVGEGPIVVLLHGNPTSSYLWRDVIPELAGRYRCIAPDLIGMGASDKLPDPGSDTYAFATHARFFEGFVAAVVGTGPLVLVLHDWGTALGFDWANRHRTQVRGIAYMEGFVRPFEGWHEFSSDAAPLFQAMRSADGETIVLERNLFIERILPGSILRTLGDTELAEYRRPFPTAADRWPMLAWPRQIPVAGEPTAVAAIVADYAAWMSENDIPKLFVNAEPGAILTGAVRDFCRRWRNQTEFTVAGSHFIQEDSAQAIGMAVVRFLETHVQF